MYPEISCKNLNTGMKSLGQNNHWGKNLKSCSLSKSIFSENVYKMVEVSECNYLSRGWRACSAGKVHWLFPEVAG